MRSQTDKAASRRTPIPGSSPGRTSPPAAILEERSALPGCERFTLCWRNARGRQQVQTFATADDLLAALDLMRRRDDVLIRSRAA